jgi:hypothetical protein
MATKHCYKCGLTKDVELFNKKGKGLSGECKECNKARLKIHYYNNKANYLTKNTKRKISIRNFINELKLTLSCLECKESHPACLQFHHRNPQEKSFEIAVSCIKMYSIETIKSEINKCDVLCANCHSKHHWKIRNNN